MPVGVRQLTVLGVFKSFGLIAEALEGKPPEDLTDKYDYFLFHPDVARARDEYGDNEVIFSSQGDHELFMRGNRIIWSIGARVFKRFTLPSPVIMACWCCMGDIAESLLCILQTESLTIYNTSGELVSIPLPCTVTSIWPLPFGLLLQQVAEGSSPAHIPFSPSSPLFGPLGPSRSKREVGFSPVQAFSHLSYCDHIKGESVSLSSHLILKDPLEELQSTYVEERGKLSMMKDFDERTIWSSDCVPLAASYNKGKMQHSVWVIEATNSNFGFANSNLPDVPASILPKQFSFRRIWQGKGVTTAASKVFLATDDDASPVICFLLQEQKKLLSVRLQTIEINNDILFDIKPDMSWSIPAVAAEPVIVTHPGVKVGLLPYANIIALAPENVLFLYSGNQCLCRYLLPPDLGKGPLPCNLDFSEKSSVSDDLRIIGVADAVDDRINVILNNGQMFRCALRRCTSSSLANECILALSDGLSSTLYNRFLLLFWGHSDLDCVLEADSPTVFDWTSFSNVIVEMCRAPSLLSQELPNSSWEFLINSKFHKSYSKYGFTTGFLPSVELNVRESDSSQSKGYGEQISNALLPSDLLVGSLDLLHAVYESLKMDSLRKRDLELLAVLLCKIAEYLGEEGYLDHYLRDFPCLSKSVGICKSTLSHRTPPSLFRWLENCLQHGWPEAYMNGIPPLILKSRSPILSWARKIICFYFALCGAKVEASKLPTGFHCNIATGSHCTCEEFTVLAMVGEKFGLQDLDRLPSGVSLPLRHALDKCRESPPTDWPAAAYVLLGREDLALSCSPFLGKSKEFDMHKNLNLISMSTPYMLHLHPVTIPSTVSESLGAESTKIDDMDSPDGGVADGMEHIFSYNTQLRFGRDLRLNEVRRLLCSASPVAIQTPASPTASDQDLQQAQLWQLAQRTTTLPLGRGAFTLGTIYTLLTEAFTAPKLVLAGRLPAQQNATVNLDPNIRNIQELRSWPEFHNAVAAGLRLAPAQGKVSRTWVIYNKPNEPNVIHAGLLLALGLHGFLRVLTITDMFQYFAQEHDITTVGLMLGLAASYRGTMQPDISKSLYVHIPARHSSSVELELPTVLQSAALLSVGLLYEGSAHQQTMQILLGEIGRRSAGDNVLEREGYAVSAGFSLGLVALGRGEDALGFSETMVDRLFHYVGGRDASNERSLQLATTVDEQGRTSGQMMDGTAVNVDVTAPGAIMALALIYMKSDSDVILSRLNIPQTHFDLQYMRPDFILLRVLARNLIMWQRIHPSGDWIQSQIPDFIKVGIKSLREDDIDIDEMDAEAFVQAYVNIVAGACISLGLRFVGTKDRNAQELLYEYAMYFLNEIKPISATSRNTFPKGLSQYVDRGTLEICLHLIVLSLSVVMAGSGHMQTFRLLRFLRNRTSADGHANYGIQMAVSMAIGFLFLGGGTRSFSTSNSSIAALLITLYPRLPTGPNDNRCHLQAFRHLYVLATEARWLQTVDVGTGLPVYAPVEITLRETELYSETSFCEVAPCILPERSVLKRIRVCGPRYWPQVVELVPEDKPWWVFGDKNDPFNCGILYIKRKVGACSYVDDPIGCQSLLSRAMHKVFSLTSLRASDSSNFCSAGPGAATIDQLVSAFSSDPSLIAFAQLCCGSSWNDRSGTDFQEFCLQILFECVSKDKPTLLQVYLTLYTTIGLMAEHVFTSSGNLLDSLSIPSIKVALAYNEALLNGRLTTPKSSIVQSSFLCLIRKRVEGMLHFSEELKKDVSNYLRSGTWPDDGTQGAKRSVLLSWHLQWYDVPAPYVIQKAIAKIKPEILSSASVPFLRLLLPSTSVATLEEIDRVLTSSLLSK